MLFLVILCFACACIATALLVRFGAEHARRYGLGVPQRFHFGHDYVAAVKDAQVVVGSRLHAMILALVAGAPTIAISAVRKVHQQFADIVGEMKSAGIVAVSDDGRPVPTAGIMRRAMEYAGGFDLPVVDHCQDLSLSAGGVMHEGRWSCAPSLRAAQAE